MGLLDRTAHFQEPGPASPGWGQRQRWGLDGATPSVSIYDADFGASDGDVDRAVSGGFLRRILRLPLSAPTITRSGTVSAQLNSGPAARFFQSYTGSGTGRNWSAGTSAAVPRTLSIGWNPNAQGAAELHPATTYDPFPSPGDLYPKVV